MTKYVDNFDNLYVLIGVACYNLLLYFNFLYLMGCMMKIMVKRDIEHGEEGNTTKKLKAMAKALVMFFFEPQYGVEMIGIFCLSVFMAFRIIYLDTPWDETSNVEITNKFFWARIF